MNNQKILKCLIFQAAFIAHHGVWMHQREIDE